MPTTRSLICSDHFVGNIRSKDPQSPSYIPSIFPKMYNKPKPNTDQQINRYNRSRNRSELRNSKAMNDSTINTLDVDITDINVDQHSNLNTKCDVSTQVSLNISGNDNFIFECIQNKNNVNTQVSVPKSFDNNFSKPCLLDKMCGPDSNEISYLSRESFKGFESITNEKRLISLTGTSFCIFNLLLSFLKPTLNINSVKKENRLLIFLIKIKLGISYSAISVLFGIDPSTVSRIFTECLNFLSSKTKDFIFWPDKYSVKQCLPEAFKINYPDCRCIIDCTEVKVEQPNTVEQRVYLYSRYKSNYTIKFLVAINPNGMICFVSKCYGGRSSDSYITNDSGFLKKLEPGDQVLADKGFPGIQTEIENSNSILIMPPILHNGRFSETEILETFSIASVRIHIERVFARMKMYGILNKLKINLLPHVDDIVHICCVLTNLQSPIIKS